MKLTALLKFGILDPEYIGPHRRIGHDAQRRGPSQHIARGRRWNTGRATLSGHPPDIHGGRRPARHARLWPQS